MDAEEELSLNAAIKEIGRVDRRVRHSARGVGLMFLIVGVATMVYWPVMFLGTGPAQFVAAVFWVGLTIASCVYWYRIRVHDRRMKRIDRYATAAYVATMVGMFAFGSFALPSDPTAGWAAVVVVLAVITGAPLVLAAWMLLAKR